VDAWLAAVQQAGRERGCPRATGPEDFGYSLDDLRALARAAGADLMTALRALPDAAGRGPTKPAGLGALAAGLEPVFDWQRGCDALAAGRVEEALAAFEEAARARPAGRIYDLSAIDALARLDRFPEAEARLDALTASAGDDPRLGLAAARIGLERPDIERLANEKDDGLAEEFFFVLLYRKAWTEATRFAEKRIARARELRLPDDLWVEHAGDAAFFMGNDAAARASYEAALAARPGDRLLLTKLSDVLWRLGDMRGERSYRERVFGTLERSAP
jgi:tetratricopeptide (TPR) repeat protein